MKLKISAILALLFCLNLLSARATMLTVTSLADSGAGTLRDTLAVVQTGDTIQFDTGLAGQTILLTSGELKISSRTNLTIDASALPGGVAIDGNHTSRIFDITNYTTMTLNGLVVTNGKVAILNNTNCFLTINHCTINGNSTSTGGSGIMNNGVLTVNASTFIGNTTSPGNGGGLINIGTLTLNQDTFSSNSAVGAGGGIYNLGVLTVNQCTFSGNSGFLGGGGIYNRRILIVNQSTFSGNLAMSGGGGIFHDGTLRGTFSLFNSIVAGNRTSNSQPPGSTANIDSITGSYTNLGVNVVDQPVTLAPLGYYGGLTQTMPPLVTATNIIDRGSDIATNASYNFSADQRGYLRLAGAHVDVGAVEAQIASQPPVLNISPLTVGGGSNGNNGGAQIGFTGATQTDFTVYGSTNLALPLVQWQNLGHALETPVGSGQYQFADPQAAINGQSLYRVSSP